MSVCATGVSEIALAFLAIIDAAEVDRGLRECILHQGFVADIDHQGQCLAAGALDLLGRGIDRALELRMRRRGFCGNGDIGAVARGAQRNRKPDAARGAGDEQGLAGKRHNQSLLLCYFLRAKKAAKAARASSDFSSSLKCIASVSMRSETFSSWLRIRRRGQLDGVRRQCRDLPRGLERGIVHRTGIDHGVDDAGFFGVRGRERPAHDEEREGPRVAHALWRQEARCRFRNESELEKRRREYRAGRGDDMIAMEQHGRADADGSAADRRDQRLLVPGESMQEIHRDRFEPALGALLKIADIAAGAERILRACEHDAADGGIAAGLAQGARHLRIHRLRQRVLLLRPVHADDADSIQNLYGDFLHNGGVRSWIPCGRRRASRGF